MVSQMIWPPRAPFGTPSDCGSSTSYAILSRLSTGGVMCEDLNLEASHVEEAARVLLERESILLAATREALRCLREAFPDDQIHIELLVDPEDEPSTEILYVAAYTTCDDRLLRLREAKLRWRDSPWREVFPITLMVHGI